jgi:hypothetical protein
MAKKTLYPKIPCDIAMGYYMALNIQSHHNSIRSSTLSQVLIHYIRFISQLKSIVPLFAVQDGAPPVMFVGL